jgi:hypothetical protein
MPPMKEPTEPKAEIQSEPLRREASGNTGEDDECAGMQYISNTD